MKQVLASGKFLSLIKLDGYEMAERINCTGVVAVVAVTPRNEVVFVEQYRKPVDQKVIELPAGLVSDNGAQENMIDAARRELLEETGFEAENLEQSLELPTSCGMSSEIITLFFATGLKRVDAGGGDEQEAITVHVVPMAEIDLWLNQKIKDGYMVDPKLYAGLYLLQKRNRE